MRFFLKCALYQGNWWIVDPYFLISSMFFSFIEWYSWKLEQTTNIYIFLYPTYIIRNLLCITNVIHCTCSTILKGSVRKKSMNKNTMKNNHFWSLLILFLSVASMRRNLLKTTYTEERSVHSESCNKQLGS